MILISDNIRNEVEDILDEFDFYKVKKVMDFLEWKWYGTDGVPTIGDLRKRARQLILTGIRELLENDNINEVSTGSGGIYAKVSDDKDHPKVYIELKFVISEWNNYD